ncbi:MAG TPA: FtsX-like permease family protein [Burkholderiaceae bacterium]
MILQRWLIAGEWRAHPLRAILALVAIAIGVALGFAVDLINGAAFNEFTAAVKSIAGQADLQVRGIEAGFDENLFPPLAQRPGVQAASPVLEINAAIPGRHESLTVEGIDVFRAAAIAPDLIGVPATGHPFDTLADDAIFLSTAAMESLHVKPGDTLTLLSGTRTVPLHVAGGLVHARAGQRIAVMDIGAAQWRFQKLGQLTRIDLKLAPGVNRAAFKAALTQELAGRCIVSETQDSETSSANLSRAYRVNLDVLALVALFTGAFLVFSTQALSVIRRRQQFAFLRVMGLTRRKLIAQILCEGALLGVIGALLGIALGYAMAVTALHVFGGDLGGGYFSGVQPSAQFDWPAAALFFTLGSLIALAGSFGPAWEAARAIPAAALKSGSEDGSLKKLATPWPGLLCLALGGIFTRLPALGQLPIFGYLAVALLLIGAIMLMPRLAALVFGALEHGKARGPTATLALARLAHTPNQAAIALGGVLSSFSLMVAMAIMVASFRVSVDDWLGNLLTADVYLRTSSSGDATGLNPDEQAAVAALPGVATANAMRAVNLRLQPDRPAVVVLARSIDAKDPGRTLPLVGDSLPPPQANAAPVWISEAMTDLYGWQPGQWHELSLGGSMHRVFIAGTWRDYARQTGSIQMRLQDYRAATGDLNVSDMALHLAPGASHQQVIAAVRALPFGALLDISQAGEIRQLSLRIFDRSFAVTYLLEAIAMVIGLFGVAATFSAQTFARAKEFGMLRHVGLTKRQILGMLAIEGGMLTAIGIVAGFALGTVVSLILVFVINPQSFHWSMQLHMPWKLLGGVALTLLASSILTALASGRGAVAQSAVQAVREDW